MKTAEVAIEHILTGMLALCAFVLPLLPHDIIEKLRHQEGALVGALGAAYLFGVVFDRLADSILSPIEDYLRLLLANDFLTKNKPPYDPFPQDQLEFSLRGDDGGRLEWMDSLRSRIRTSRGLSVLGLPAAMGIAIFLPYRKNPPRIGYWWPYLAVSINVLLFFLSVLISTYYRTVRTFELARDSAPRELQMHDAKRRKRICSLFYILILVNSAATILLIERWPNSYWALGLLLICGALAIWFPWWVWRRITETYMRFIYRGLPELLDEGKTRPVRRVHR